jgi:hypothetical protein
MIDSNGRVCEAGLYSRAQRSPMRIAHRVTTLAIAQALGTIVSELATTAQFHWLCSIGDLLSGGPLLARRGVIDRAVGKGSHGA